MSTRSHTELTKANKGILVSSIIEKLNEQIRETNKQLCSENRYTEQKPVHGATMFFKLAFMDDSKLQEIAIACGL